MSSIWRTLGIDRTDDRSEIRRAYARRLKVTHPEDDAAGFQKLRDAYEAALSYADHRAYVEEVDDEEPEEQEPPAAEPETAAPDEPDAPRQAASGLSKHQQACAHLDNLLRAGSDDADRLHAALDAVLASEAMESLAVHAQVEIWLARSLLHAGPAGDPLLDRVVGHFRWADHQSRWDAPGEVRAVLERREDLRLLAQLDHRNHRSHRAYRLLLTPPSSLGPLRRALLGWRAEEVRGFLQRLADNRPSLIDFLDPEALAWWRKYLSKMRFPIRMIGSWAATIGVIVLVMAVLAVIGATVGSRPDVVVEQRARQEPGNPEALADLCRLHARQDILGSQALGECDEAVKLEPRSLTALDGRALVHLREQRWEQAIADYERILALSPNDARALFGRGVARQRLGEAGAEADIANGKASESGVDAIFANYRVYTQPDLLPPPAAKRPQDAPLPEYKIRIPHGAVVTKPDWRQKPAALVYPAQAQRERIEGKATVRCVIAADGALKDCVIWSEYPQDHGFGEAALKALSSAWMNPATVNGKPVDEGPATIPFVFRMPTSATN